MFHSTRKFGAAMTCAGVIVLAIAGCNADSLTPTDSHMAQLDLSAVAQSSSNAQALNDLRRLTAPLHDLDAAIDRQYSLLIATPLTAPDGCISDPMAGGMGYHYSRFDNLGDDSIELLNPEFLVYAPKKGQSSGGDVPRRLGALEYFIPYSSVWPGPDDAHFIRKPRLGDFPSFGGLPDVELSPTPFNGWAIHIWLWEHNPAGMLTNFNKSVPQCQA